MSLTSPFFFFFFFLGNGTFASSKIEFVQGSLVVEGCSTIGNTRHLHQGDLDNRALIRPGIEPDYIKDNELRLSRTSAITLSGGVLACGIFLFF